MAVLVASGLRKELSGDVLFDGVSLTVRRGDRVALAGANGAGKTTLRARSWARRRCRRSQLSFAKDADRAARPASAARRGLTLREYALSGAASIAAIEEELHGLEQAMAGGDDGPGNYGATATRSRGSSGMQAAGPGADAQRRPCAASASRRTISTGRSTRSPAESG